MLIASIIIDLFRERLCLIAGDVGNATFSLTFFGRRLLKSDFVLARTEDMHHMYTK